MEKALSEQEGEQRKQLTLKYKQVGESYGQGISQVVSAEAS